MQTPSTLDNSSKSWIERVSSLSEEAQRELMAALTPRTTKYMTQEPTPQQAAFLLTDLPEVLFGGAGGGGKSSALLMAALQYVDVPGYAAVIFRRTFADLAKPGALMDRAFDWLGGTDARWDGQNHAWHFPSGATLAFGHLEVEKSKYDHQGAEYQFIGFDELTQFKETQYRYLFSRLRRLANSDIPLRMRAASNPGGEGHEWVYRRFFTERYLLDGNAVDDRNLGRGASRAFIPARIENNPHLDQQAYRRSLSELDPVTRRQLEHGDWEVREAGEYFKREWFTDLYVTGFPFDTRWLRYWDLAATEPTAKNPDPDWTVGTLMGEWRGTYFIKDVVRFRKPPAETLAEIQRVALLDGINVAQHFEQEPGASSKVLLSHIQRDTLKGFAVYGHTQSKDKTTRAKPFSAACSQKRVKLLRAPWNSGWFDRMEPFPVEGVHDDEVDSASGAYTQLHMTNDGRPIKPLQPPVRTGLSGADM